MRFAVVDIEGTDGNMSKSRIMEIAVYVYDENEIVDSFSTLVNPGVSPNIYVQRLTGITPKMLKRAPKFYEIAKRIVTMTGNTVFTAHNAPYDYGMLRKEFMRLGYDFRVPVLDTFKLSQELLPELSSHGLDNLLKQLHIPITDRHRAYGDALATLELLKILLEKDPSKKVLEKHIVHYNKLSKVTLMRPSLMKMIDRLPESRGLLKIFDGQNRLLYVDYAPDIKRKAEKLLARHSMRSEQLREQLKALVPEPIESPVAGKIKAKWLRKKLNPPFSPYRKCHFYGKLPFRNALFLHTGKDEHSKSFYLVKNGRLEGFGFASLHIQWNDYKSLRNRMMRLHDCPCAKKILAEKLQAKSYFEIISPYPSHD